jgi:hypothetical protein
VGAYTDAAAVVHGLLLSHGQYTTVDDPNAVPGPFQGTALRGINALGQISGDIVDANSVIEGFVLSRGQYTTLDDPNAGTGAFQGTIPGGINDVGMIVGDYTDAGGVFHGFVARRVHDDASLGAAGDPASASAAVDGLVAAAAPWDATAAGAWADAASPSGANRGDSLGDVSTGHPTGALTVLSPPAGNSASASGRAWLVSAGAAAARQADAIVDAAFARSEDPFGPLAPS